MKVSNAKFKTVTATTASGLDEQLAGAKEQIRQQNPEATFVDLRFAASQSNLYATLIYVD